jgi:hypothetical protein
MDQLTLIIISAVLNGVFAAIGLYIGMTKGTSKTVDKILDKIEERSKKSATAQRLIKALEASDKLFGDDQTIAQVTRFFKTAGDFLQSQEARTLLKAFTMPTIPSDPPLIRKVNKIGEVKGCRKKKKKAEP